MAQGCTNNNENSCTWTQPFTSGRVRTKLSPAGSWLYGRVQVRAQLPKGSFLWPAIWLLPTDDAYGVWVGGEKLQLGGWMGEPLGWADQGPSEQDLGAAACQLQQAVLEGW